MRKLTCYEWIVLVLCAALMLYCAGWLLLDNSDSPGWHINTQRTTTSLPTPDPSPDDYPESLLPGEIINLNTATRSDLLRLPTIGATKADAILAYRQTHGAFQSVDALRNVSGIGPVTLDTLRPYLSAE